MTSHKGVEGRRTLLERLSDLLSSFNWTEQPESVRQKTKAHLLDSVGLMLLARQHPNLVRARSFLHRLGGQHRPPQDLAFLGAVAAEALALDDFDEGSRIHPGAVIVPSMLAAGLRGGSGRSFLEGVLSGYEASCRLGVLLDAGRAHLRGFHPSSVIGAPAAAAAVARFQDLDIQATANSMGLAASLSSGLFELDPASSIKGLQVGWAARSGFIATLAHEAGYQAAKTILEGPQGMFHAFGPRGDRPLTSGPAVAMIQDALDPAPFVKRVSFKPYTHFTDLHPLTSALLELLSRRPVTPQEVDSVTIVLSLDTPSKLNRSLPPSTLKWARRCPRFAVAALICQQPFGDGDPLISLFHPEGLKDPHTLRLANRIQWRSDSTRTSKSEAWVRLKIRLHSGELLRADGEGYPGDGRGAQTRWSLDEVSKRFFQLHQEELGVEQAGRWVELISHLDSVEDVTPFVRQVKEQLDGLA